MSVCDFAGAQRFDAATHSNAIGIFTSTPAAISYM